MTSRDLLHTLAFQAAWVAAALLAAAHYGVVAATPPLVLTGLVIAASPAALRGLHVRAITFAGALGLGLETVLVAADLVRYASPGPVPSLAPAWIVSLWLGFGTLVNAPLSWLRGRPILAAAAGALLGPLAYAAGARLGAIDLRVSPPVSLLAIAAVWTLAMWLLMRRPNVPQGPTS